MRERAEWSVLSRHQGLQGSQQRGSRILGFFWVPPPPTVPTPAPATLIVVTQAGLELWTLAPDSQVLTFREARKHPTLWHVYSHEMRLVLLGSGEPTSLWLQVISGFIHNLFCPSGGDWWHLDPIGPLEEGVDGYHAEDQNFKAFTELMGVGGPGAAITPRQPG